MDRNEQLSRYNMSREEIDEMFRSVKVIAVVGLSRSKEAPSHIVASYMQDQGYRIIPVRPAVEELLGEKCYERLEDVPEKIDVVNVFRRSEEVPDIVESAIAIGAKIIWAQEGVVNRLAAVRAHEAGLKVIMGKCLMKEHKRYMIDISL